jgi:thiol-disulfide isomerase/thioredoxin
MVNRRAFLMLSGALAGSGGCGLLGGGLPLGLYRARDEPVPDLVVREWHGRGDIRLRSLTGKVVLVNLWASWCGPCREELPLLDDLDKRLRGEGVEIIAVSVDEERGKAEEMASLRPRWSLTLAHDPSGAIAESLKPPTMPSSYLIDGRGRVHSINAGFERDHLPRIEARLRELAGAQKRLR